MYLRETVSFKGETRLCETLWFFPLLRRPRFSRESRARFPNVQNYVIVGESKFNGPEGGVDDAIGLAKKLGVTHILLNAKYAYDASKKAYKYVENFDYIPLESGYLAGTGQVYSQIFYEKIPNPIYVPYRKNVSVYHHRAIFLVKMKKQ